MISAEEFWSELSRNGVVVTDEYTLTGAYRCCQDWNGEYFLVAVYGAYPDYMVEKVLHENGFSYSPPPP